MPRRKRPGNWAIIYAELPPDYKAWLEAWAAKNNRSMSGELKTMMEAAGCPHHLPDGPAPGPARRKGK